MVIVRRFIVRRLFAFGAVVLGPFAIGRADAASGHWIGGNEIVWTVEFRDVGLGDWEEYQNGALAFRFRLECVTRDYTQLYDPSREVRVRLWPDRADLLMPGWEGYRPLYRGGWKGEFGSVFGVPLRYHGNYAGWGNRGGMPVDALDRAAQAHDLGYDRHGRFDAGIDGRFVVESAAAALNPSSDLTAFGRVKAAGAAGLLTLSPSVQRVGIGDLKVPVPVGPFEKLQIAAAKGAYKGVKKGVKSVIKKVF